MQNAGRVAVGHLCFPSWTITLIPLVLIALIFYLLFFFSKSLWKQYENGCYSYVFMGLKIEESYTPLYNLKRILN